MKKFRGFTLLELLVVMAISAVLLAISAPSLKQLIQSSTISSTVNTFMTDMRFARSEAIRRGGSVVMCQSANPEAAAATCGSTTSPGWQAGWIVFYDVNKVGNRMASEPILRVQGPLPSINSILEPTTSTNFQFTATGRLAYPASTNLTFGSSPVFDAKVARVVCVNMSGRARIARDSNGQPTGNASCSNDQ